MKAAVLRGAGVVFAVEELQLPRARAARRPRAPRRERRLPFGSVDPGRHDPAPVARGARDTRVRASCVGTGPEVTAVRARRSRRARVGRSVPGVLLLPARPSGAVRTRPRPRVRAAVRDRVRRHRRSSPRSAPPRSARRPIVPERACIKIDPAFPLELGALVGCGVVTGVGAVCNSAHVEPGASVVVIGCGGVGLAAIQGARLAGAAPIIAVDRVASKLELARRCGATETVDASTDRRRRRGRAISPRGGAPTTCSRSSADRRPSRPRSR